MTSTRTATSLLLVALLFGGALAFAAGGAEESRDPAVAAAQKATEAWLALVDAGRYDESWSEASTLFRNAVTEEAWGQAVKTARGPLGALRERRLTAADARTSLPGAPDGHYVVFQFATVFEHKAAAVETVTPMLDSDGRWRVSGYYVR